MTADPGSRARRLQGRQVPAGHSGPIFGASQRGVYPCRAGPCSTALADLLAAFTLADTAETDTPLFS